MRPHCYVCAALLLVAGCGTAKNSPQPLAKTATLDVYIVSLTQTPNTKPATDPDTNAPIFLTNPPIISAADVTTIQLTGDSPQSRSLTVNLSSPGETKLAAATLNSVGMRLAVVANGTVVAVPTLHVPLSGAFCITGGEIAKNGERLFEELTKN
jgi:preprotein translocase subunit SecD